MYLSLFVVFLLVVQYTTTIICIACMHKNICPYKASNNLVLVCKYTICAVIIIINVYFTFQQPLGVESNPGPTTIKKLADPDQVCNNSSHGLLQQYVFVIQP